MTPFQAALVFSFCILISPPARGQVLPIASPADSGSSLPSLTASPDGRIFLSWVERSAGKGHALKYSILAETSWSVPRTVAEGKNWFVNWADFPSMAALPDGALAAHWLERSGTDTYAYDVRIALSFDAGMSWGDPITPHRDGTPTEHGFVSLFPGPGGALGVAWLDGREMAPEEAGGDSNAPAEGGHSHGTMTLRYAALVRAGEPAGDEPVLPPVGPAVSISAEAVLDEKVCECCQTAAAISAEGPVIVYRDRGDGEVRDISIVRGTGGEWSRPASVSRDGWKIDGCPVNGPAIDAAGRSVAVAWFTAAGDTPRVKIAFSADAGVTFGQPIVVDDGSPSGRVDVVLPGDGSAVVSWMEKVAGAAEIRARRVRPTGTRDASVTIAPTGSARSSGFPRMAMSGNRLIFAWTADRVRTALLSLQ